MCRKVLVGKIDMAKDGTNRGGARKGAGRPTGIHTPYSKDTIDRFRARIQTNQIIDRLNKIALGDIPLDKGDGPMVTAAVALLRKTVPDQASVEHSGEIATTKVIRSPSVADTAKTWAAEHVPEGHTEH